MKDAGERSFSRPPWRKSYFRDTFVPWLSSLAVIYLGMLLGYPFHEYGDWAWILGGVVGVFVVVPICLFVLYLAWRVILKFIRWAMTD